MNATVYKKFLDKLKNNDNKTVTSIYANAFKFPQELKKESDFVSIEVFVDCFKLIFKKKNLGRIANIILRFSLCS